MLTRCTQMLDCAEICQTSANFMLRGPELHSRTCGVCAEICERCARDCEYFGDDAHMPACAEPAAAAPLRASTWPRWPHNWNIDWESTKSHKATRREI